MEAPRLMKFVHKIELVIIVGLLLLMLAVVAASTIELLLIICQDLASPPYLVFTDNDLFSIFSFFFMVLIGMELLETIKMYLKEELIHVEVVFLVAMIAVARKVIIMDVKTYDPITLLGIGAIIIALSAGYFLVKRAQSRYGGL